MKNIDFKPLRLETSFGNFRFPQLKSTFFQPFSFLKLQSNFYITAFTRPLGAIGQHNIHEAVDRNSETCLKLAEMIAPVEAASTAPSRSPLGSLTVNADMPVIGNAGVPPGSDHQEDIGWFVDLSTKIGIVICSILIPSLWHRFHAM